MKKAVFLLLILSSFAANASDAVINMLDRNFTLPGPCVYTFRTSTDYYFECNPDGAFETSYSISLLMRQDFRRTQQYVENCREQACETETQKLLRYQNQIFRGETHFYIAMQLKAVNGNPESVAHKYTICGNNPIHSNPCLEINSLSDKYIRKAIEANSENRINLN